MRWTSSFSLFSKALSAITSARIKFEMDNGNATALVINEMVATCLFILLVL